MNQIGAHFTRCFVAGVVAMLPLAGTIISIVYIELTIAESWLARQPYYFPGMGIVAVGVVTYLLGLTVTTFLGRWAWRSIDRIIDRLPALGILYRTLKQVLGYGEGKDGMFHEVVLVPGRRDDFYEIGLVTSRIESTSTEHRLVVFVPGAPTPTAGRLIILPSSDVVPLSMSVSDALRAIVSVGKTELPTVPPAPTRG